MDPDEVEQAIDEITDVFDGCIVVGFVVVADIMDMEGNRWLSHRSSDGMPSWVRDGMLNEVLNGDGWGETEGDWDE